MQTLSDWLFEIGFFPIIHEAVKQDFLSWFYKASQSELLSREVDLNNSQLTELALEAQIEAENFDQSNSVLELIKIFEDFKGSIDTFIYYFAGGMMIVGSGLSATDIFQIRDLIYTSILGTIGEIIFVSGAGIVIVYKIAIHQMKTNSELLSKFNEALVEKPGEVRRNDQDWNRLAAQVFWNKSLLSPTTHICLIILSVIRTISPRFYGYISADIQQNAKKFVGMDSVEIIKHQINRLGADDDPTRDS